MEDLANKVIPLVQLLIPGFVVTTIFYWLSESPKPGQFERTIQALIGTGVISLIVSGIEWLLKYVGGHGVVWGAWSTTVESAWAIGLAILIGFGLAFAANHDSLYQVARRLGFTSRASYKEWIYAFRKFPGRAVVLNFLDGRRLFGYPLVWPTDPKEGHFLMQFPAWIADNDYVESPGVEFLLVCNADVYFVEILNSPEESI
ncbi:DUF6338 family protein [Pseudomonas batumici]|uniref:DUF6338 family protein n=1 Tax=Pseudomonas batumici TaxID=226910 RepID=UPI0030D122CA